MVLPKLLDLTLVISTDLGLFPVSSFVILFFLTAVFWKASGPFQYYSRMTAVYVTVFIISLAGGVFSFIPFLKGLPERNLRTFQFAKWITNWTGMEVEVRGAENLKSESSYILVCNHQSALDARIMGYLWPQRCVPVMKLSLKYVFNIPGYLSQTVFIDRSDTKKAIRLLNEALERVKRLNQTMWMFPEGTRKPDNVPGLLPFKKGAFCMAIKAQIPVVPVVVSSLKPFCSKSGQYFHSDGYVIAEVLEPVSTQGLTCEDSGDLMDTVRDRMCHVYEQISREAQNTYLARRKIL